MGQIDIEFIYEDTLLECGVCASKPFLAFKSKHSSKRTHAKGFAPMSLGVCSAIKGYIIQMEKYLERIENGKVQSTVGERKDPSGSGDNGGKPRASKKRTPASSKRRRVTNRKD